MFVGNGELGEDGKRLIADFRYGLTQIMESFELEALSENDLRVLESNLHKLVGDAFTGKISYLLQVDGKLQAMSDQEFEAYLQEKYGSIWRETPLTPAELRRVRVPSHTEFQQALEQGRKEAELVRQAEGSSIINPGLHFRK